MALRKTTISALRRLAEAGGPTTNIWPTRVSTMNSLIVMGYAIRSAGYPTVEFEITPLGRARLAELDQ